MFKPQKIEIINWYKFRYKFSFKKNEKDGNSDYFEIYSDNPNSHDVYDLINSYFDGYWNINQLKN